MGKDSRETLGRREGELEYESPNVRKWKDHSAAELLREIGTKLRALARKELELIRAELRGDLVAELRTAKHAMIAGVAALVALNLLCMAAVFGLARVMPDWAAALCLFAIALGVAAGFGAVAWRAHVRKPLARSRRSIGENLEWTKERLT